MFTNQNRKRIMEKRNEKGHLSFIIQGRESNFGLEIMNFYLNNRYFPGLTGAVVFNDKHVLVVLEGEAKMIVDKFMSLTNSVKAFIEVVSTGPLLEDKRSFNSWDLGLNVTNGESNEIKMVTETNQEEISSLSMILKGREEENDLKKFVKSFLLKGHKTNYNKFWEENS